MRPVLITGGAGFIGANIADRLASEGRIVLVLDSLQRFGVERNLAWLVQRRGDRVRHLAADIRDAAAVEAAVREAGAVIHLAAQVAVTTSLLDPAADFAVNLAGTVTLLEAVRRQKRRLPLVFASTNKVYGDLADVALEAQGGAYAPRDPALRQAGVGEGRSLDFHTPYGCSKGGADQYVLDYARSFDLPACVLRMSCIYGPLQQGSEDQGWVAHFLMRALAGEPIRIFGDGRQVRDVLCVSDAVQAYVGALQRSESVRGRAFNLGGGPANAVSLLQLIGHAQRLLRRPIQIEFAPWRAGDQRWYVSDASRARQALGLGEPVDWRAGVASLLQWLQGATSRPTLEAAL
ncbi:MAG TPA: SDR family NAD(P)-dependent oxidoreductase [Caulobacteraceae bacterium]|nr:SDR family NAD(P)-dependent oxidoreductase [Caulobacteraceae bacterium]